MLADLSCDSIDFAPAVTHIVLVNELRPSRSVQIIGPGAHLLTLDGNNKTHRVFTSWVPGSTDTVVEMSGLTITGGGGSFAAGVLNLEGTLTLRNVIVADNHSTGPAGGIRNSNNGTLHLIDALVANNTAAGTSGGVESHTGALTTMKNVTIRDNTASAWGGGFYTSEPSIVENSTISDNVAQQYGGVFAAGSSQLLMINSTIANNAATNIIGGLGLAGSGPHYVVNTTVANNTAANGGGGGIRTLSLNGVARMKNVVVAGNSPENCVGNLLTTLGVNVSDDETCVGFLETSDMQLGPLADNGGPTWTMALLDGSPAIDVAVDCTDHNFNPVLTDQRGVARPMGAVCDAGAYETTATVVADTEAPVFGELPDLTFPATSPLGAIVSYGVDVTDNEDPDPSVTCVPPSNSTFAIGETTVECTTTDAAGNSASASFTVTVFNTPPKIMQHDNIHVEATGPGGAVVTFDVVATDAEDGNLTATCTPESGSMFPLGSTKVLCSAIDSAGADTGVMSFLVWVEDTTAPVLAPVPDIVVPATSADGAVVTYDLPMAFDLVDPSPVVTCEPASGSLFPIGTTSVHCVARDASGNGSDGSVTSGGGGPAMPAPGGGDTAKPAVKEESTTEKASEEKATTKTDTKSSSGKPLPTFTVTVVDDTTTVVTCPATVTYTGSAIEVCSATTTSLGGLNVSVPVTYTNNVNAGTATANASYSGDALVVGSSGEATFAITPQALTVTANSYTRSYTAVDPVFDGTLTGVVGGDGITATYASPGAGSQVPGVYPTIPSLHDPLGKLGNYTVSSANGTLTITNTAPVCSIAPSITAIWPANHQLVSVTASGATDVDGGPLTYTVVAIFQDEPTNSTGDGNTAIDGFGVGTSTAQVRAERVGGGNGRVYHITWEVTDSQGLSCQATTKVGVPHDQRPGSVAVDDGPIYNSTVAGPVTPAAPKGKGGK